MSDPAIRAALEAAAWADCEARAKVNECEDKRCPRHEPCQWCADGSVAAVAAFLRALHRMTPLGVIETRGGETYTADCDRLAAAVEEAANA